MSRPAPEVRRGGCGVSALGGWCGGLLVVDDDDDDDEDFGGAGFVVPLVVDVGASSEGRRNV